MFTDRLKTIVSSIIAVIITLIAAIYGLFGDAYTRCAEYTAAARTQYSKVYAGSSEFVARPPVPLIKEFKDITRRAVYMRHAAEDSVNVHNGQLKLFLTELQFLTLCLKIHDAEGTVVYAGSAPSNKISYLARLFPKIKFVLVDPHEHYIMFPENVPFPEIIVGTKGSQGTKGSLGSGPPGLFDDDGPDDTFTTVETNDETTDDESTDGDPEGYSDHPADMYSPQYAPQVLFFQAAPRDRTSTEYVPPGLKGRKRAHRNVVPMVPVYKPRADPIPAHPPIVKPPQLDPIILEPTMTERLDHAVVGVIPDNLAEVIDKTSYRFYIIENLFTNELAEKLAKLRGPVYFISDIRTTSSEIGMPLDYDICMNSAMMYNWLARLKPARFMLKFRCPWTITEDSKRVFLAGRTDFGDKVFGDCPIDFRGNFAAGKFEYIKPEHLFIQAFAGATSTETRLVGSKLDTMVYDQLEYEEKFMWFNTVHRQRNPIIDAPDNDGQHIKCYNKRQDCALAVKIFDDYLTKFSGGAVASAQHSAEYTHNPQTAVDMLHELLVIIGRTICKTKEHHEYKNKK